MPKILITNNDNQGLWSNIAAESNITVTNLDNGEVSLTINDAALITGPTGATGATGAQGDQGEQGPAGFQGSLSINDLDDVAIINGPLTDSLAHQGQTIRWNGGSFVNSKLHSDDLLNAADLLKISSISTTVQAYDDTLTALAGVTTLADKLIYATASDTFTTTDLSSFGRSLIDDADASAARTTLGLSGFSSDGTNMTIIMTDNQPFALDIKEGTNSYLTFGTGNNDEKIVFKKNVLVSNKNIEVQDSGTNKIFLIDSTDESVSVYDKFYVKNSTNDINKFSVDLDGNVDVSGSLDLTGDLNINTNKFNVSYTSGNTTIAGDLNVTGTITGTSTTQTALDNSTKLATTEYVQTATRVSNTTKTANYTLVVADEGKLILMDLGTATTVTIPTHANAQFPTGAQLIISRIGAGTVNISPANGVTLNSVNSNRYIANQYGAVTLIKTDTNNWYLFGDLASS